MQWHAQRNQCGEGDDDVAAHEGDEDRRSTTQKTMTVITTAMTRRHSC